MTDAIFLNTYRDTCRELAVLERQLASSGSTGQPHDVTVFRFDATSGTNDPTSAAIQLTDGLTSMVAAKRAELAALQPRFDALMLSVPYYRDRYILLQYYRYLQSDDQIALCLSVTPRHVRRLRRALLDQLRPAS